MNRLFPLCLFIVLSCSKGNDVKQNELNQNKINNENRSAIDTSNTRLFEDLSYNESMTLVGFQKDYLDQLVANGDGEFETDTSYTINFVHQYDLEFDNSVFYIKGKFIPSDVDFHFYGVFNDTDTKFDVYHLPIDTYFTLTKYEMSSSSLRVYGILGNDRNTENSEVLLIVVKR